jgi:uncharacterized RDD family membrane protein YckC
MSWAPPPEVVAGPGTGGLEYSGAGPRFVAWFVDGLLLGVVASILFFGALALFAGSVDWSQFSRRGAATNFMSGQLAVGFLIAQIISVLINLAYFVFFWTSGSQATPGMRLLSLKVANSADGATLNVGQAVKRWFALGGWLGVLNFIPVISVIAGLINLGWAVVILLTTIASPTKQGMHDRFASTVVVQPRGGSSNGLVVGCLAIVGLFILLFIVAFIALFFIGSQISSSQFPSGS